MAGSVKNVAIQVALYCLGILTGLGMSIESKRSSSSSSTSARSDREYKMVLVVNSSLKMGKGKIGAQCAHGACGAVETASTGLVNAWKRQGQKKVCLQAQQSDILELYRIATKSGLNACLVADAGRTQIAAGSKTVLAIGPDDSRRIDAITGSLKLL